MKKYYLLISSTLMGLLAQSQGLEPEILGDLKARQIGPAKMSGRVTDIEGHPTDSRIIWIGTAGGGVWKSENAGVRFKPVFDKNIQSIGAIAISPANPNNEVWVGTGEVWTRNSVSVGDGIYKTIDGGLNWTFMGLEKSERISAIKINPKNPNEVYVGVLGALWGNSADRGVYKTSDGGKSWKKLFSINDSTGCADLTMDPSDPNTLYASFWQFRRTAYSFSSGGYSSALYKTTDGGQTWAKVHNGFPAGQLGRIAVAVAPSAPKTLYAVIECEKPEQKGLYRSDDGGANWKHLNSNFELVLRPFYFSRIVIDPKNPDVIMKAGLNGSISIDGGKTFRTLAGLHADVHDFYVDPNNSSTIFAVDDGGVWRSWDRANTFEHVKALPISQYYHVSIDNASPYNVYGGLQDNGSWIGPSDKLGGITNADWLRIGVGDGFRVLPHPTKPIVYSEMQGAENIWRYDLKTMATKNVKPRSPNPNIKLRFNWNAPLATSNFEPNRLYTGSQFVHRTNDMGESWTTISPDLTTNDPKKQEQEKSGGLSADNSGAENHCTIFSIAESPLTDQIIWVGTDDGQIQVTTDGGKNWRNCDYKLGKKIWAYHVEPSSYDKNTCFAVLDGHTQHDMDCYVIKTTDGGNSWQRLPTAGVKGFARHIRQDPVNPDLLYLGTEMGLYISLDGGKQWLPFTNNMPPVPVHYMAIDKATNDLVLATHGRGIIIIDNVAPLRALKAEALNQELVMLDSKKAYLNDKTTFGTDADAGDFVGATPNREAQVIYYLKSRHTFGPMTMDVLDANDKVIANLIPGKKKGINIVSWDGMLKVPKQPKGKTVVRAFSGPRVLPGEYKLRITKGKNTYFSKFVYELDPSSPFSLEDKKANYALSTDLYRTTEDLAYFVYDFNNYKDYVDSMGAKHLAKNKDFLKLRDSLAALQDKMVVTKGDNYVGTAEPRLREKLGELYGQVSTYYGRPGEDELKSAAGIQAEIAAVQRRYAAVQSSLGTRVMDALRKAGVPPPPPIKDKETFLAER